MPQHYQTSTITVCGSPGNFSCIFYELIIISFINSLFEDWHKKKTKYFSQMLMVVQSIINHVPNESGQLFHVSLKLKKLVETMYYNRFYTLFFFYKGVKFHFFVSTKNSE